APPLRSHLEPEDRPVGPRVPLRPQGEPQVVLVGTPAVEPPGVPVDPGNVEVQPQLGPLGGEAVVDLLPQRRRGLIETAEILLLVGLEPGPVVVEADPPQKVQGLLTIALKHAVFTPALFFSAIIIHSRGGCQGPQEPAAFVKSPSRCFPPPPQPLTNQEKYSKFIKTYHIMDCHRNVSRQRTLSRAGVFKLCQ